MLGKKFTFSGNTVFLWHTKRNAENAQLPRKKIAGSNKCILKKRAAFLYKGLEAALIKEIGKLEGIQEAGLE